MCVCDRVGIIVFERYAATKGDTLFNIINETVAIGSYRGYQYPQAIDVWARSSAYAKTR